MLSVETPHRGVYIFFSTFGSQIRHYIANNLQLSLELLIPDVICRDAPSGRLLLILLSNELA